MRCLSCVHWKACFSGKEWDAAIGTPCKYFTTTSRVHCKDCQFNVSNMSLESMDDTDYSGDDIVCSYFMTDGLEPYDYCSHGKHKDEVEE